MSRTPRDQGITEQAAPEPVRETDANPGPALPSKPTAQQQFERCTAQGWTTEGWRAWLAWCLQTDGERSSFLLGGDDGNVPFVLRDFDRMKLTYSDLCIKYGTCSCPVKPCRGTCGTLRSDREAYDMVTGWIVERGGLDSKKAREILEAASLGARFDEVWPLVIHIGEDAGYMNDANSYNFPDLARRGSALLAELKQREIV